MFLLPYTHIFTALLQSSFLISRKECIEVDDIKLCTPGSTGYSCDANDMAVLSCRRDIKREVCSDMAVSQWSESVDISEPDPDVLCSQIVRSI